MKILIVEDEARIARRLKRMCNEFFGGSVESIQVCESLVQALTYLSAHEIDLLLLDLNLNGEDGFELLQRVTACAFHTIIISAYTEKDGSITYTGRILSRANADLYELKKNGDEYEFVKRNYYDLVNE